MSVREMRVTTFSSRETILFARKLATILRRGDVVIFEGGLGSGKTTFIKGILDALGFNKRKVVSPTFTIIKEYRRKGLRVYHIDLYRIERKEELINLGYEDYFYSPEGITLIEWGERIEGMVSRYIKIKIKIKNLHTREIIVGTRGYGRDKIVSLVPYKNRKGVVP